MKADIGVSACAARVGIKATNGKVRRTGEEELPRAVEKEMAVVGMPAAEQLEAAMVAADEEAESQVVEIP